MGVCCKAGQSGWEQYAEQETETKNECWSKWCYGQQKIKQYGAKGKTLQ